MQKCCAGADGTDWNEASCKDACDGYTITCDDAADCGAGEVCCFTTDGGARTVQSYCSASACPSTNGGQFCALGGDECGQSRTCTALTDFGPSLVASCQ